MLKISYSKPQYYPVFERLVYGSDATDKLIAQRGIPVGEFTYTGNKDDTLVPFTHKPLDFVIETDEFDVPIVIELFSDGAYHPATKEIDKKYKLTITTRQPNTNIQLAIKKGLNAVIVKTANSEYISWVYANYYCTVLFAFAREIYNNTIVGVEEQERAIYSDYATRLVEPWIRFQDLLPETKTLNTIALKLITKSHIHKPATDIAVNNSLIALTQSTPILWQEKNSFNYEPAVYPLFNSQENFAGYEAHVWLPNLGVCRWLAFTKLINNIRSVFQIVDISENQVIVKINGSEELHRFYFEDEVFDAQDYAILNAFKSIKVLIEFYARFPISFCAASYTFDLVVPSFSDLLYTGTIYEGEALKLGGTEFTYRTTPAAATDIAIGATTEETIDNTKDKISNYGATANYFSVDKVSSNELKIWNWVGDDVQPYSYPINVSSAPFIGQLTSSYDVSADPLHTGWRGLSLSGRMEQFFGFDTFHIWKQEVPGGIIDGINDTFTISGVPSENASLVLFMDGLLRVQSTEYSIAGSTITFLPGHIPVLGQTLLVRYDTQGTGWIQEQPTGSIDGFNLRFSLSEIPASENNILCSINGRHSVLGSHWFYDADLNQIVFLEAPAVGSVIVTAYNKISSNWHQELVDGAVDGINDKHTLFKIPYQVDSLLFFVDGLAQDRITDYNVYNADVVVNNVLVPTQKPSAIYPITPLINLAFDSMVVPDISYTGSECVYPDGFFTQSINTSSVDKNIDVDIDASGIIRQYVSAQQMRLIGTVNGINTDFSILDKLLGVTGSLVVSVDGVVKKQGTEYTVVPQPGLAPDIVRFATPPMDYDPPYAGQQVPLGYYFTLGDNYTNAVQEEPAGIKDGTNPNFTLSVPVVNPENMWVTIDGITRHFGIHWTATAGSPIITFFAPHIPVAAQTILVWHTTTTDWKQEEPVGLVNGSNNTFTLSQKPASNDSLVLTVDGLWWEGAGSIYAKYTVDVDTKTITTIETPKTGQKLWAWYLVSPV